MQIIYVGCVGVSFYLSMLASLPKLGDIQIIHMWAVLEYHSLCLSMPASLYKQETCRLHMWAAMEYHFLWARLHRCLSWRQRKASASWAWLARCHVKSQEGRSYDGKLRPESDSDTQTSFTFASVSECEECLGHNVSDVTLCNTTKTSAPAPSARILASDWLRVTWILASDWLR